MRKALLLSALALLAAQPGFGYVLEGPAWTKNRTVQMQLSLGGPHPLIDGFASFNQSAADALAVWNEQMAHMTFAPVSNSPVIPSSNDYEMSVAFATTVFGDTFGAGTLAVTLLSNRGGVVTESDTLFNSAFQWDSYGGPLRPGLYDFHRVALHEFGHVVGLDHPDENGQTVVAIMNSHVSDIATLQPDDIAGAADLYGTGPEIESPNDGPILANLSTRGQISSGDNVLIGGFIVQGSAPATLILRAIGFSLSAQGLTDSLQDPVLTVYDKNQNAVATNDDWISGSAAGKIASYHLDPPNTLESALFLTLQPGSYTAVVSGYSDANQTAQPGVGLFELYDLHTTAGRAGNISTRGQVLTGDEVLIGGFIIGGSDSKSVVVRALGPSLGNSGVSDPLGDPFLELHDGNGNLIESNDNWAQNADAQAIQAEGLAPQNAKESALQATLPPGSFTAIVSGVNGATGVGLVEVYDLSPPPQ
jgi:hypothetical protein